MGTLRMFADPPIKGREELIEEIVKNFRKMRDSRRGKMAFRELTEGDILRAFREVLIEEIMES